VLIDPVSEPILEESELIAPPPEEPELIVEVSAVTEVVSADVLLLPLPQAAKAPITNTNNNFFIVSLLNVIVYLIINTPK